MNAQNRHSKPGLLLILMAISSILVLAGLLLYFAYNKINEYQPLDPAYQSGQAPYDEYSQQWQNAQYGEEQLRKEGVATYQQMSQYSQDQLKHLKTEEDLRRTFSHFK